MIMVIRKVDAYFLKCRLTEENVSSVHRYKLLDAG
jgi:hypothetical protein